MKKQLLGIVSLSLLAFAAHAQWDTIAKPNGSYATSYVAANGGSLYAAGGVGIYKYNTPAWTDLTSGALQIAGSVNAEVVFPPRYTYVRNNTSGIYARVDSSNLWWADTAGLPLFAAGQNEATCMFTADTFVYLALGSLDYGLYRKRPEAAAWTKLTGIGSSTNIVWGLTKRGTSLYAATSNGCWTSTNKGNSWTKISNGSFPAITAAWKINSVGSVFTEHKGQLYYGTPTGVYKSSDGFVWTKCDSGFASQSITCLYSSGNFLYASTKTTSNAYRTGDTAATWVDISAGLTSNVTSFALFQGEIYAALKNQKPVYHLPEPFVGLNFYPAPTVTVYPNPMQHMAAVSVTNMTIQDATFEVFSLDGKRLYSVEHLKSGSFAIDRGSLKSGVYFYVLKDENQRALTGKLVIE